MKKAIQQISLAVILSMSSISSFGLGIFQPEGAVATAGATAVIVQPIEITKDVDLVFGNIAAGTSAGVVSITTDGIRSGNGGVTLISAGNVSNAATFSIVGYPEATYSITLPSSITITSNGDEMVVDNFVSDLGESNTLSSQGTATLNVGASLNVEANQAPGLYNGTFEVVVAYN